MIKDNRIAYVDILGRRYPMCLTVSANARLDAEFGGFAGLQERLQSDDHIAVYRDMMKFAEILIEGGRERVAVLAMLSGETVDIPPALDADLLSGVLTNAETAALGSEATRAFILGNSRTVEAEPADDRKNAAATQ